MTDTPAKTRTYNYKLGYLRAIAIILVVIGHAGFGGLNLDWFSPYSFHLPLFIFAAGYFYDERAKVFSYVKKRFRRLVVSYYSWNLFYAVLFFVLTSTGLLVWNRYSVNLETFFVEPWFDSAQYALTAAAWFALSLFLIQLAYALTRKTLKKLGIADNEYLLFMIFLALGLLSTYWASLGSYSNLYYLNLMRTLFGLPFLQLGYLYKVKLERFDKVSFLSIATLFVIRYILILANSVPTFSMLYMQFGGTIVEPFLSSFTGIWLCLQISTILATHFRPIKLLRYIGDNSWSIMFNQFLGFWLFNSTLFLLNVKGFELVGYKTNVYYEYVLGGYQQSLMLYILVGIFFSLAFGWVVSKTKAQVMTRVARPTINSPEISSVRADSNK